jgi:putative SOS response-associated peptidase YedK
MCGRYSTGKVSKKKFEEALDAELEEVPPSFNVCPDRDNPTIAQIDGRVSSTRMRWDLVSNWSKELQTDASSINARSETMAEKPFFRNSFRNRRCLAPADGWYEWRTEGKRKIPFFIHLPREEPFAFASLWDSGERTGVDAFASYAVITTEAHESVRFIHHRMPVILPERHWGRWLDASANLETVSSILKDALGGFESRTVSDLVNDVKNEGSELIKPVKRDRQGTLEFP